MVLIRGKYLSSSADHGPDGTSIGKAFAFLASGGRFPDQLSPFDVWDDFDPSSGYKGTIIRIPLREDAPLDDSAAPEDNELQNDDLPPLYSEEAVVGHQSLAKSEPNIINDMPRVAAPPEGSEQHSVFDLPVLGAPSEGSTRSALPAIREAVAAFKDEMAHLLLFLSIVEHVMLSTWPRDAARPQNISQCSVVANDSLRQQRITVKKDKQWDKFAISNMDVTQIFILETVTKHVEPSLVL